VHVRVRDPAAGAPKKRGCAHDADVGTSAATATPRRPRTLLAAIAWLGLEASAPHAALAFVPAMAAPFVVGRITFCGSAAWPTRSRACSAWR
jgi:hypothetical protein